MIIPVSAVLAAIVTIGTVSAANCWATVSDNDPYPSTLAIGKLEEMRQTICNNYWNLNVRLTTYAIPPSNWGTDWFASSGPYSGSYWGGEWTVLNLDSQSRCWGGTADVTNNCVNNRNNGIRSGGEWDDGTGKTAYGGYWFDGWYSGGRVRRDVPDQQLSPLNGTALEFEYRMVQLDPENLEVIADVTVHTDGSLTVNVGN